MEYIELSDISFAGLSKNFFILTIYQVILNFTVWSENGEKIQSIPEPRLCCLLWLKQSENPNINFKCQTS